MYNNCFGLDRYFTSHVMNFQYSAAWSWKFVTIFHLTHFDRWQVLTANYFIMFATVFGFINFLKIGPQLSQWTLPTDAVKFKIFRFKKWPKSPRGKFPSHPLSVRPCIILVWFIWETFVMICLRAKWVLAIECNHWVKEFYV